MERVRRPRPNCGVGFNVQVFGPEDPRRKGRPTFPPVGFHEIRVCSAMVGVPHRPLLPSLFDPPPAVERTWHTQVSQGQILALV